MAIKEKDLPVSGSYGPGVYVRTVNASGASQKTGFAAMKEALDPTIDSALSTSSTNPVQNKVINGAITDLKEDIEDITGVPIIETSGYFAGNGSISVASETNQEVYTNSIKVKAGDKIGISLEYPVSVSRWVAYGLYTEAGAWIERVVLVNSTSGKTYDGEVVIPEGTGYIAFTYRTFGYENVAVIKTLTNLYPIVLEIETDLDSVSDKLDVVADLGKTLTANDLQQGEWINGVISPAVSRLCTKVLYPSIKNMIVNFNTTTNLYIGVLVFDENNTKIEDSGWLGGVDENNSYTVKHNGRMGIIYRRTAGGTVTPNNYVNYGAVTNIQDSLSGIVEILSEQMKVNSLVAGNVENILKPMYDHLFVNSGTNAVIPHESLYHVRISKRLGFNVIEANLGETSDGVYVVNHFNNGKFGTYFHHVDGTTDISNTLVSSVTWDWIVANVRYNSTIPKYRTRPCRLEEFLGECKQQGLIPLVIFTNSDIINIVESYMGENNYIAYEGTRDISPEAIIYKWKSLTTKEAILNLCRETGKPMIYGMSNINSFTDAQLKEIVSALHSEGFWIGTSYADNNWYKYSNIGFDVNGTQRMINRIEEGNKFNIDSVFGFSEYEFTNATETDGVLTFSANGTLSPDIPNDNINIGGMDLQVTFNGSITVPAFGELTSTTYTSDGSVPVFVTTPILNASPKIVLQIASGTVVTECTYRVIEC